MCEASCKIAQIINSRKIDSHLSNVQRLLKNEQKSDSFDAHLERYFSSTTSRMDLRKCMTFNVGK